MSTSTELTVIPWTGEQVDISKPQGAAHALEAAVAFARQLSTFRDSCSVVLREQSDKLGQRTFHLDGYNVEVTTADAALDPVYDIDKLWHGLEDAGLPPERLSEVVVYEPKVNGQVIRQLRKNPAYAAVIAEAITEMKSKPRYVRVTPV